MPVLIYGKDSCPYTADAREHYGSRGDVQYINVKKDAAALGLRLGVFPLRDEAGLVARAGAVAFVVAAAAGCEESGPERGSARCGDEATPVEPA